ncbi:metalloregulator ArsR/SmtB family transcription factor, partial [Actinosynnema sp. NPDC059335]|uniref:metalloregulator ArsR/SmtB family transcription factor n=1 Tax=Actinosynnema sp. NPDC059335 TaxID=3346804 RepID=UPI00366DC78E
MDEVAGAIADPVRREIMEMLRADGRLSAGRIADRFAISRPAVSRHLRVLRESGLVRDELVGRQRFYLLDTSRLTPLARWLATFVDPGTVTTATGPTAAGPSAAGPNDAGLIAAGTADREPVRAGTGTASITAGTLDAEPTLDTATAHADPARPRARPPPRGSPPRWPRAAGAPPGGPPGA